MDKYNLFGIPLLKNYILRKLDPFQLSLIKFSFLRNPYYHNKDESLLRRGYQVKPLQEMVSTQSEKQYT